MLAKEKQLSVFIENKVGHLAAATDILAQNDISIRALFVYDSTEYAILRLIVDDPYKAMALFAIVNSLAPTISFLILPVGILMPKPTRISECGLDDKTVILVDDVLYSGCTICATCSMPSMTKVCPSIRHSSLYP